MNRRLYRSRTDTVLGGIAAGLAAYLNTDPTNGKKTTQEDVYGSFNLRLTDRWSELPLDAMSALIDINTAIMRGLRGNREAAAVFAVGFFARPVGAWFPFQIIL